MTANRAELEHHHFYLNTYSFLIQLSSSSSFLKINLAENAPSPACDLPEPEAVPTYLILVILLQSIVLPIMKSSRRIPPPAFFSVACGNRGCSTLLCLLTATITTTIQPLLGLPLARLTLVCLVLLLVCQPPSPFLRPPSTRSSDDLRRPVPLLGLRGLLPLLHPSRMPDQTRSLLSPIRLPWNRL